MLITDEHTKVRTHILHLLEQGNKDCAKVLCDTLHAYTKVVYGFDLDV